MKRSMRSSFSDEEMRHSSPAVFHRDVGRMNASMIPRARASVSGVIIPEEIGSVDHDMDGGHGRAMLSGNETSDFEFISGSRSDPIAIRRIPTHNSRPSEDGSDRSSRHGMVVMDAGVGSQDKFSVPRTFTSADVHSHDDDDDDDDDDESSGDETDTCKLSIDEHIVRRMAREDPSVAANYKKQLEVQKSIARKYQKEDSSMMSGETDSCQLSIDEHLARRLSKWKKHKRSMGETSRQRSYDNFAGSSVEELTLDTNSLATNELHTEDECGPEPGNTWSAELNQLNQESDNYGHTRIGGQGGASISTMPSSTLSPVEESVISTHEEVSSGGDVQDVQYVSNVDTAPSNHDLSVEEHMGMQQARSGFSSYDSEDRDDSSVPSFEITGKYGWFFNKHSSATEEQQEETEQPTEKTTVKKKDKNTKLGVASTSQDSFRESMGKMQVRMPSTTLSPVEEAVLSTHDDDSSSGRLQHVHYVSKLDIASTNQDLSTVEPMGKKQARAAFTPGRPVPREIQTTLLNEADSADNVLPYNGMVLPTPPVDSYLEHDFENGTVDVELGESIRNSSHRSKSKSSRSSTVILKKESDKRNTMTTQSRILAGRNEIELFLITIISCSLFVLVILLIFIVANGN